MKLQGKVAVVTGGGRGIGRAICLAFADEGADVLVAADVESQVKAVAAEVEARRRKAIASRFDVVKPDEVEELLNATLAAFGRVDVLGSAPIAHLAPSSWVGGGGEGAVSQRRYDTGVRKTCLDCPLPRSRRP